VELNGTALHNEPFVDGALTNFSYADIAALAGAGDAGSQRLIGTAFFDNYIVSQVPEPSTIASLTLGALCWLACCGRRTKRA
jgi:hypothetical protein